MAGLNWFRTGAVGTLLFGCAHLVAVYKVNFAPPPTPEMAAAKAALESVQEQFGPLRASAWGGLQILNASYSILLFQVGVLSLSAAPACARAGRLASLTWINLTAMAALLAVSLWFQFPPPAVFAFLLVVIFAVSLARQQRVTQSSAAGSVD